MAGRGQAPFRALLRRLGWHQETPEAAAEHRLLSALLDTPSALCAAIDRTGRVIFHNERFREVLAPASDPALALDNPELRGAGGIRDFAAAAEQGATREIDLRLDRPDEAPRYLHVTLSQRSLPERGLCTVLIGHDETKRHQVQLAIAQSAKLVTMGELTTGMAHELSQPLNVMRMAAQNALAEIAPADGGLAVDGDAVPMTDAEFRAFVAGKFQRIVSQVDRAADILSRMRIFGRTPRGGPAPYDARDACGAAVDLVKSRLLSVGIDVRQALADEPLITNGHANLLEQVIVNLLLNARDALKDSGSTERRIEVKAGRGPDLSVCITVADNGPGVPAEIRDRIFEPFFTGKPLGQGTGLGLALSFGMVQEAGGELTLLPATKGAAFQISLPAAAVPST